MLDSLGRACVIFSDLEGVKHEMLSPKIEELRSSRALLVSTMNKASQVRAVIGKWSRGPTAFNLTVAGASQWSLLTRVCLNSRR
jgi:hypothetical protein